MEILHMENSNTNQNKKIYRTIDDSKTEMCHLIFNKDLNSAGRLFGGQLLMWIDEVAGIVARRHCCGNVTTASIDNLQFKNAVYANEVVVIIGYITHVGRTSMEVRIDTYVEKNDGKRYPVNRAFFVMVGLDENDKPTEVPGYKVETVEQQAKWDAAEKRIELRKQRKLEGF